MSRNNDDRALRRERGKAALVEAIALYPVGQRVLFADCDGLPRWGKVTGHKLNMAYQVLIVTSGGVCYPHEVQRRLEEDELEALDRAADLALTFGDVEYLLDGEE